ncbi:MAG: aldolase/citrate lyase family protein [Longimicrobiales bacterium]|nr:aldolase/citrate lyase family protein [Longimicrobiales bacterium]
MNAKAVVSTGAAGPTGTDVRSDGHVTVTMKSSGGVRLTMQSKVGALYGDAIRKTAKEVLSALGVKHARVEIDDGGALPFVLAARVEAAARRAGAKGTAPPERTAAYGGPTDRKRPRRSRLYLPGGQPKFMINAGLHRPDAVILDLEDSVHPADKDSARVLVRNALRCVDFMGAERMVRINQLPLGLEDLDEIVPEQPHLILIPKVERPEQVTAVRVRIAAIAKKRKLLDPVWIMPIIESALGVENAFAIATAAETIVALTIGLEDYTADIGVPRTPEGTESVYARTRLSNAAHAAGLQAIDSVFSDVADMEALLAWARASRGLGFEGMGCIHPRQIGPIHEGFAPTDQEVEKARLIVAAFEDAEAKGLGVVSLGTKMIDLPVVLRAQRVLAQAQAAGRLDPNGGAS